MINVNENVRRNGERVWVSWTNKVMLDEDGHIECILAIGNDITDLKHASDELKRVNDTLEYRVQQRTAELASAVEALQAEIAERKRVETQIQSSLQEKEVLLKEIHHRVKNNLQIISSLLSLQSENINSQDPVRTFRESQDRIRSMALIHEKLYQARDISRVDFAEYVKSLTLYLSRSHLTGPGIKIVIGIDHILLDIDTAIPCGLIINELVSNSLKYAFRDGRTGEIRIAMTQDGNRYTLVVADNGSGLPPGLDFRNTPSLGLQLVNTLVDQLEGAIELDSAGGTRFKITFAEIE
jgi:two-component sensor histidine kinase